MVEILSSYTVSISKERVQLSLLLFLERISQVTTTRAFATAFPYRCVGRCRVDSSKAKDNDGENYGNRSACGDCGASWGQDRDQHAGTHSGKTSDSCYHDGRPRIGRAASCHRSAHSITRTSAVSEC